MSTMRRMLVLVAVTGFGAVLAWLNPPAIAQQERPLVVQPQGQIRKPTTDDNPADSSKNSLTDSITLPTDRKARRSIEVAEDFIKQEMWGEAARVLQTLLDTKEDVFVEVSRNDKTHWASLRREANRLIGVMPQEGRQFYELQYGARAKTRMNEAKAQSDPKILAEVAQRFMHTEAGAEASNLLGTYHLDRGNVVQAALCFERVLSQEKPEKTSPLTLLKAALAFRRAGDADRADQTWKLLTRAAGRDGVKLGGKAVSLDQLKAEIDRYGSVVQATSPYDWAMYRGNASRSAQGNGGAPFLQPKWTEPTFNQPQTGQWLEQALAQQQQGKSILPAYFPLAATVRFDHGPVPLLICRTHNGIQARDLKSGAGKIVWATQSLGGLDNLIADPDKKMLLDQWNWIGSYMNTNANMLCENSTVGTLSTDNQYVYIIEDLALPPHPGSQPMANFQWGQQPPLGKMADQIYHNRLEAFDLRTGKFSWFLGGRSLDKDETTDAGKLSDCYFLGPPLPIGDKLYVLVDKNSELRLVCLERSRDDKQPPTPTISWMQTLAHVRDKLLLDVNRRVNAAHLSYGDGILVCPTNAGVILGVDVLSQSFAWAYAYREDGPTTEVNDPVAGAVQRRRMPVMGNGQPAQTTLPIGWKTSAPAVHDGKVVFTAPDASSVHCLDARTGELIWKQRRDAANLRYMAGVFGDKVFLVGDRECVAYNLADGKRAWITRTGMPSGQGVASDNVYYLPLRSGEESQKPEVCALDIQTGRIIGSTIARPDEETKKIEIPGNLLFYEGDVVSQTADRITVYRQLRFKRQDIDVALQQNANDPNGLFQRGEIKLEEGDLQGAVDDLQGALANTPAPDLLEKTRSKLFQTYTKLIQRDFNAGEKYLAEYEAMCDVTVPADAPPEKVKEIEQERQRRRANYLCLLGKGRERQGRITEAFQAYMDFGAHAAATELVSVIDEPTVRARPDVWAQGRIAAMVGKATPEQRKPIEELIRQRWDKVRTEGNTRDLRDFVSIFGSVVTIGNEARFQLAERLTEEDAALEAELHLLQLRRHAEPQLAARAVEALARLMMKKYLLEDAAHWYRVLGDEFAQVVVRDGKRGADFLNDLATDKRLLAYVDGSRPAWTSGRIRAKEVHGNFGGYVSHAFEPEGEVLPFFERNRLVLQNPSQLKLIDRNNNEPRFVESIPNISDLMNYFANMAPNVRMPFEVQGHLFVVNVGDKLFAFDPIERKKLWEHSLYVSNVPNQNKTFAPDRDGRWRVIYADEYSHPLGRVGPVEPSYVCFVTREGLTALDPLQGTILWTKSDVPKNADVFGDDKHIFLVDVNKGKASAGRALRARDGVAVDVPDFAAHYQDRLRVLGRKILVSERKQGSRIIRLYDVLTGSNVWERAFSASAIVLQTEEPDLVGVIDSAADGKLVVFDVHSQKDVLVASIEPKDLEKNEKVYLLADANFYYVICNRSGAQPGPGAFVGGMPNVMSGIRCLPINGMIYAFERATGKFRWKKDMPDQMLVMDQYKDIPILLFTASQNRMAGGGLNRGVAPIAATRSIEKRTGKLIYDRDSTPGHNQFFSLVANVQAGTIELVGNQLKVIHYIEGGAGPVTDAAPSTSQNFINRAVPRKRVVVPVGDRKP